MPLKKSISLIKYGLVPLIAYFFYWAIIYEMGTLGKPIQQAFMSSIPNWIILIALIGVEITVLFREYKARALITQKTEATKGDPWEGPPTKKVKNPDSLKNFMRSSAEKWDNRIESAFDSIGQSSFHKHLLLKVKRFAYGICFILYVTMALMSLNDIPFLILFVLTAYAFLENLLWARLFQWVKRKHQNE